MKLEFVEMSGFRGFRDKTRFEFPTGFAVFSGRNGAGKSTVLDAVDFALTGTINKFDVKTARGGGINEHIWWVGDGGAEAFYVSVGFVDDKGERISVTRSRDRGLHSDADRFLAQLCNEGGASSQASLETLLKTTLIRDEFIVALSVDLPEQARFAAVRSAIGGLIGPDHSERTGAILRAAKSARDEQGIRLRDAQSELGRALTTITEARSTAERSPDISDALRTIEAFSLTLPTEPRERTEALRGFVAERKRALGEIEAARRHSEAFLPELLNLRSPDVAREIEAARAALENATRDKERADQAFALAERAHTAEQESDSYAAQLAALIEHGTIPIGRKSNQISVVRFEAPSTLRSATVTTYSSCFAAASVAPLDWRSFWPFTCLEDGANGNHCCWMTPFNILTIIAH
jgi:chromosome segregation protein